MGELYAEVHGSGPALVLIPGGGGDAGVYGEVAQLLAKRHTVITYDRRGNSRSRLDHPNAPIDVAAHARDVVSLLDRFGLGQAGVFGSSGGAIIAAHLVAHFPDRLTFAVAHEPPLMTLLDADSPERRTVEEVYRRGVANGPMRGFAEFAAITMTRPPHLFRSPSGRALVAAGARLALSVGGVVRAVTGRQPDTMTRMLGNVGILIEDELPAFCFDYVVDLEAVCRSPVPWVVAIGADSTGRPYARSARVLAERAGVDCVRFPGGHTVYQDTPSVFAERLVGLVKELEQCREQD